MRQMLLRCPSCGGRLTARRLECSACALTIDSSFEFPAILRLTQAQLDFVEVFIKNRGVIRDVERELGVSYPTVRAKLDEVVAALGLSARVESDDEQSGPAGSRRAVLEKLREGQISAEDALRMLRQRGAKNDSETGEPER